MLFAHVFVNIAMTIGLMPVTGLPLPLISYGGSFMLSTMMALGLTQSVYTRRGER
jgi:rod shape determining protein RodA